MVGPPGLELIYTFKLAFTLDTSDPSRATQASRVWTPPTCPEHPKRQVYGRSAWFYMRCVFACKMIKANRSPEACFHSETTPQRPCANKSV
jgi:hypothetical protein